MGMPRTNSMTKKGRSESVLPRVEYAGDVRMLHLGQSLAFGFKALYDLASFQAGFDNLDRDLSLQWTLLFSEKNNSHTAFSEPLL